MSNSSSHHPHAGPSSRDKPTLTGPKPRSGKKNPTDKNAEKSSSRRPLSSKGKQKEVPSDARSVAEDTPQPLDAPKDPGSDELNLLPPRRSDATPAATRPNTPAIERPNTPTPSQRTHSSSGSDPKMRDTTDVKIDVGTLKSLLALVSSEERKEIIARLATARQSPSHSIRTSSSRAPSREER
jgi:hypothetical protein